MSLQFYDLITVLISSAGGKETGKCDSRLPCKHTYITVQEFHLQMAPAQAYATTLHECSSVSVNSFLFSENVSLFSCLCLSKIIFRSSFDSRIIPCFLPFITFRLYILNQ